MSTNTQRTHPLNGDEIIGTGQSWPFLPLLVIAWFGAGVVNGAIVGASLPKLLALLDESAKETNLAIVSTVGGIIVMLATPLMGRLSDRTTLRMGMRKPWYLGGLIVGTIGCVLLAAATSVPAIVLGWVVVQLGYGAVQMANHTLLADQVPARIRARVSAAVGVSTGIATIVATAIVAALPIDASWTWFLAPGALGLVTVLPMLVGYRDAVRTDRPAPLRAADLVSTYWLHPGRYRDFAWAWISRFFMTMSIFSISLFLFFLIMDTLGYTAEEAGGVQTLALAYFFVGNIVATILFGWLSDRLGRRKGIIWLSGLCSAAGIVVLMTSDGTQGFLVGTVIVGFAQGAYIAVDVALMTEVLPSREDAGKDLGIVALAYQLPQVIAPVIAATVIALAGGTYTGLFAFSIVCSALGGLTIIPVRGVR
ncbi:MFS transporter [Microbacterium karelineae]|uniref:MFS transporter n=1 Tax=Microbacterium karelineae TaxID=2654283 RepID=UPI0012E9C773|nr:MFS transporter [Microbacterium karelineae]